MIIDEKTVSVATSNFLDMNELVYLYSKFIGAQWTFPIPPASINKLVRMGLLENENTVTAIAENLIAELDDGHKLHSNTTENDFETFWKLYPKDDSFRGLPGSRILRYNKHQTRIAYANALRRGAKPAGILAALKAEINYRVSNESENLFKYMKSSVNWLNESKWEDFADETPISQENINFGKDTI